MNESIGRIEERGFCVVRQLYTPEVVRQALESVLEWHDRVKEDLCEGLPALASQEDLLVWNLQNKDYGFLKLLLGSTVIQNILMHFLNDTWYRQIPQTDPNYILRIFTARSSGTKAMPLHIDSLVPYTGNYPFAMQVAICLEDQDVSNGCNLIVPGSHLRGEYAPQEALRDAIPIECRSGDVVIWDSRTWHGAGANRSGRTRWGLLATFVRWWIKQAFNVTQSLPEGIYKQLTPSQKAVLGFCSIPPDSERERVDMKTGYEGL